MECSCEIDSYDDGERVELYSSVNRMAMKRHKCFECRAIIYPGDKYQFVSYLYDGIFWKEKTCKDCLSAIAQFYSGGACSGILWDDISEHIRECYGDLPESCISQLTPVARAKVCEKIDSVHAEANHENI